MTTNCILLLSSVHPPNDPRIVGKILPSLSQHFEVECYLPKKTYSHLLLRILLIHPIVFWKFIKLRPQVVHIFVAELLPLAFVFKWFGAKIIYEVQENLYKKIPTKNYNKGWLFRRLFTFFDQKARKDFNFVFTEDAYLQEYNNLKNNYAIVHNFAKIEWAEKVLPSTPSLDFVYMGVISLERAFDTIILAFGLLIKKYPTIKLHLFGRLNLNPEDVTGFNLVKNNFIFYGYTDQEKAFEIAKNTVAGLAILKPIGDYPDSYPSKIFDYMALSLPVITSDFEIYKQVIDASNCGFCISPFDAPMLAQKMSWLIENPTQCQVFGQNGRNAILEKYNWETEATKLVNLYKNTIN